MQQPSWISCPRDVQALSSDQLERHRYMPCQQSQLTLLDSLTLPDTCHGLGLIHQTRFPDNELSGNNDVRKSMCTGTYTSHNQNTVIHNATIYTSTQKSKYLH